MNQSALQIIKGFHVPLIAFGAAVLVASTVIWYQAAQIKSARAEVTALHEQLAGAEVKIALLRENRDILANRLKRQTAQIRRLQIAAADARERARIAANVVLSNAENQRQVGTKAGDSPEAINSLLHEIFP